MQLLPSVIAIGKISSVLPPPNFEIRYPPLLQKNKQRSAIGQFSYQRYYLRTSSILLSPCSLCHGYVSLANSNVSFSSLHEILDIHMLI